MIVTMEESSKNYNDGVFYNVWLNGGKIKDATYADDINGVVVLLRITAAQKIKTFIRRGKVKIIKRSIK